MVLLYDEGMKKALKLAFVQDISVMLGYIVMGIAFELMIQEIGVIILYGLC